jgi:hypothetical protein
MSTETQFNKATLFWSGLSITHSFLYARSVSLRLLFDKYIYIPQTISVRRSQSGLARIKAEDLNSPKMGIDHSSINLRFRQGSVLSRLHHSVCAWLPHDTPENKSSLYHFAEEQGT